MKKLILLGASFLTYTVLLGVETVQSNTIEYQASPRSTQEESKPINHVLHPALIPICSCESTGRPDQTPRHFDSRGNVIKGKQNKHDIGICQINELYHGEASTKLGLDIYKENDNIAYANRLYASEGSKPWNWSKGCWGGSQVKRQ